MTKRKIFLTVLCSFIAVALITLALLVYVPRTTELNYDMQGFIISTDGQILEEFTFTIYGKEYDFILDRPGGSISYTGETLVKVERDAFIMYFDWDSDTISKNYTFGHYTGDYHPAQPQYVFGALDYYSGTTNSSHFGYGMLDLKNGAFCMYANDLVENAFIVGLTDPEDDPYALIDTFPKHHIILSELSPEKNGGTAISWDMNGTFVLSDGTTDAVNFTVDGYVYDNEDRIDVLDITLAFPDNFRYSVNTPDPSFVSMNQNCKDLPHLMICPTYVYDKQTNSSVWSYLAFDLEKEYVVLMIENAPNCYLVASVDPSVAHTELLEHFADFIESYSLDQ